MQNVLSINVFIEDVSDKLFLSKAVHVPYVHTEKLEIELDYHLLISWPTFPRTLNDVSLEQ